MRIGEGLKCATFPTTEYVGQDQTFYVDVVERNKDVVVTAFSQVVLYVPSSIKTDNVKVVLSVGQDVNVFQPRIVIGSHEGMAGVVAVGIGVVKSCRRVGAGARNKNATLCNCGYCDWGGRFDTTRCSQPGFIGVANVGIV